MDVSDKICVDGLTRANLTLGLVQSGQEFQVVTERRSTTHFRYLKYYRKFRDILKRVGR